MRIRLRPKTDKRGRRYLFCGLEILNAVIFVHELDTPDERGCTHELVLKPYSGNRRGHPSGGEPDGGAGDNGGGEGEDYSAAWEEQGASPLHPRRAA